jgi:hypothetical protein
MNKKRNQILRRAASTTSTIDTKLSSDGQLFYIFKVLPEKFGLRKSSNTFIILCKNMLKGDILISIMEMTNLLNHDKFYLFQIGIKKF